PLALERYERLGRAGPPSKGDALPRFPPRAVAGGPNRMVAHDDAPGVQLGQLREAGRLGHGVADDGVLVAPLTADVAGNGNARGDADAGVEPVDGTEGVP